MLEGPSFGLYAGLRKDYPTLGIIVSGGVSGIRDIHKAQELGLDGIIVGKALYENRITLNQLALCLQNGSFPAWM